MEEYNAYVGLDIHKDTIAVAVAYPGRERDLGVRPAVFGLRLRRKNHANGSQRESLTTSSIERKTASPRTPALPLLNPSFPLTSSGPVFRPKERL
jgi:hypothetical protein